MGGIGALMGNSTLKSTLSISRHAKALCLGVKLRSRAPTCSPNEPASSHSDASLEIWENSASSKSLLDTCFFLRYCVVSDDGEGLLEVREDCLDGAAIDDSLEDEGRDSIPSDVAPLN